MHHHTEYLQGLRQKGYRLTPQREMILSVMCDSTGHLSAEEIITRVRKLHPRFNKSAVYRTLELLTQHGFINPTDLGQGYITYELHQHPHHHHLVCRKCGKIVEVDETVFAPVGKSLRDDYSFFPDLDHFAIFGLCHKCQTAEKKKR